MRCSSDDSLFDAPGPTGPPRPCPYVSRWSMGTPPPVTVPYGPARRPRGRVTGRVVFPMPGKTAGGLLVYSFADAAAIAKATHVGLARYQ